ncbi:arabinofuranosyltransferase [Planomonospora venezuelensis]|uniref:Arabinofuranosyltransferase AftA N-terminal domain-containing protein n=1 Tax=Planomonospora venezuelensis TaxID=1999 RepID=A0A841DA15_PLAVE|nr:arabinofuranosyltransferase [Planomonospora venezuelensis]MBB5965487.1 hypothetical protein [Planomonospora venezuelensis]GIN03382.1 hypothetical protein Pve01_50400 [Planomonospora venezuelensis]
MAVALAKPETARTPRPAGPSRAGPAAVATWIPASVIAVMLPGWTDLDPFGVRGALLPVAAGALLLVLLVPLALTAGRTVRPRLVPSADTLSGVAAGLFGAWVLLALRTALYGTPYGFGPLEGDMGRMSAMAVHYSVSWENADPLAVGVPSEYPPLQPLLIGRAAALLGRDAWRLLGAAEMLMLSGAVVLSFLLWRRLVSGPVALAVSAAGLLAFHAPAKAFVVLTIAVFVPWVLQTLWEPPAGRLHWAASGIVGGLVLCTYLGPFMLSAFGLLALAATALRRSGDVRAHLLHAGKVVLVAVAVSGWYLVPYVLTLLTGGGQTVSDLYEDIGAPALPPLTDVSVMSALQLAGLAGTVWYRRTAWWALPMLCLVAGLYLYWAVMAARYVLTGHTMFFHYVPRVLGPVLAICGVLALAQAAPALARRLGRPAPRGLGTAAAALLLAWCGLALGRSWLPNADRAAPNSAAVAHQQPFPDGRLPRFAAPGHMLHGFPAARVARAAAGTTGAQARPVTLSCDERLFAFLPWRGYLAVDRTAAGGVARWNDRYAELARLAAVTVPEEFARRSAALRHGPIDVFVLWDEGEVWSWKDLDFRPGQFGEAEFSVTRGLPGGLVVAARRTPLS